MNFLSQAWWLEHGPFRLNVTVSLGIRNESVFGSGELNTLTKASFSCSKTTRMLSWVYQVNLTSALVRGIQLQLPNHTPVSPSERVRRKRPLKHLHHLLQEGLIWSEPWSAFCCICTSNCQCFPSWWVSLTANCGNCEIVQRPPLIKKFGTRALTVCGCEANI